MNQVFSFKILENELMDELKRLSHHRGYIDTEGFTLVVDIEAAEIESYHRSFRTEYFYILFVSQGEFVISIDLTSYSVKKNGLLLCHPGTIRKVLSTSKGTVVTGISFTFDFLSKVLFRKEHPLLNHFPSSFNPLWNLNSEDAATIRSAIEETEKRAARPAREPFRKPLLLHTFLILLYETARIGEKYNDTTKGAMSRKEVLVNSFLAKVKEEHTVERSVAYYARTLSVSPKYLTEVIKELTGQNAGTIIDGYVLTAIKELLDCPQYSLSEIAYQLNFPELSSLGKYFRRLMGISPSDFRKRFVSSR